MISIDNLVFNTLLTGEKVYLPKVGTLGITRLGAQQLDSGNIIPPSSTLVFSDKKESGSVNVKELIAQVAGEGEDAKELYAEWLAKAKNDGRVAIDGVGVIDGLDAGAGSVPTVTADSGLFSLLNPQMETQTGGRDRSGSSLLKWLLTLCIILLVLLILIAAWHWGLFRPRPAQTAVITQTDTTAAAKTAAAGATSAANGPGAAATGATGAAGATNKPDSLASTAPATSASGASASASVAASASKTAAPSASGLSSAAAAPAPSSSAAPAPTAKFYVVAGIFRLEKGADARMKSAEKEFSAARKEFPDIKIEKVVMPDGKFMVSIFKSDTRSQAQHIVNRLYYSLDNEIWVWEKK